MDKTEQRHDKRIRKINVAQQKCTYYQRFLFNLYQKLS